MSLGRHLNSRSAHEPATRRPPHRPRLLHRTRHLSIHLLRMARQGTRTPLSQAPQRRDPHPPRRLRELAQQPGGGRLMQTTYDVRVWEIQENTRKSRDGRPRKTYTVRWKLGLRPWKSTYGTKPLADSFRAELLAAMRKGEPFNVATGRPVSSARGSATTS